MDAQQITYQAQIAAIEEFRTYLMGDYLSYMDRAFIDMQVLVNNRLPYDGAAGEVIDQLNYALTILGKMQQDLIDHITVPDNSYLLTMIDYLKEAGGGTIK